MHGAKDLKKLSYGEIGPSRGYMRVVRVQSFRGDINEIRQLQLLRSEYVF